MRSAKYEKKQSKNTLLKESEDFVNFQLKFKCFILEQTGLVTFYIFERILVPSDDLLSPSHSPCYATTLLKFSDYYAIIIYN